MKTYKLENTKPGETPDQTIIRCANNLVKAVLASGRSIEATSGMSVVEINFYDHMPSTIIVASCLSHWDVRGKTPLQITFKREEPINDLTQDDTEGEAT